MTATAQPLEDERMTDSEKLAKRIKSLRETSEERKKRGDRETAIYMSDLADALEREDVLREALDKARDPGREPDYCYDEDWEYTMAWAEWPDLMDGHDLTEPTAIYTLYKGPRKWAVRVPTDGDDIEVRIFDSEEAARAALGAKP